MNTRTGALPSEQFKYDPVKIIAKAIWPYFRFLLSFRVIQDSKVSIQAANAVGMTALQYVS